jgi:hypothetical protein
LAHRTLARVAPLAVALLSFASFASIACNLQITGDGLAAGTSIIDSGIAIVDSAPSVNPPRLDPASPAGPTVDGWFPQQDAALPPAPDASIDASAADPCDRDHDGHRAVGGICGGDDCCDFDPIVFPGQTNFFAAANACGNFDFDCDGKQASQLDRAGCHIANFQCVGDGFGDDTKCGDEADFFTCDFAGLLCLPKKAPRKQQLCH